MFNRILPVQPASCTCPGRKDHHKKSFSRHSTSSLEHTALPYLCLVHLKEPDIHIEKAVLDAWKNSQLANAEALLTAAIPTSKDTAHVLAGRALVRARLQQWDAAFVDAEEVHSLYSHSFRR